VPRHPPESADFHDKIGYAMSMSPLGPMQVDVFFQELEKGMIFLYGFDVLVFNEE